MSDIFAGIAVFLAGVEEYNVFISLISSTNGCIIDNKSMSTPAPVSITSLTETVRSMILSTFPQPTTITSYLTSVPPALPPDRYYSIFKAIKVAYLTKSREYPYPSPPLNHGEAFAAALAKGGSKNISLVALDFSCPGHLYAASLSSTEANGKRVNTVIDELSVSLVDDSSLRGALETFNVTLDGTYNIPEQIMLIKPPNTPKGAESIDIDQVISTLYPDVPLSVVTGEVISQAAVSFAHANSLIRRPHIRAQYGVHLPTRVATMSGATVPLSVSTSRIPLNLFITLTNSIDNQKSVTVRLLLGNHKQAKDNIERAVVVLDGLKPLPKGEARIKVLMKVLALDGWREAVCISIEQEDGPKKKFLFPRFSAYLPENYTQRYDIPVKQEKKPVFWSDNVLGRLPE